MKKFLQHRYFALLLGVSLAGFLLGYLGLAFVKTGSGNIFIEKIPENQHINPTLNTADLQESGTPVFVGSKNSTLYYLSWCSGANNISDKNKVYFSSRNEAEKKGYKPASSCKEINLFDRE